MKLDDPLSRYYHPVLDFFMRLACPRMRLVRFHMACTVGEKLTACVRGCKADADPDDFKCHDCGQRFDSELALDEHKEYVPCK